MAKTLNNAETVTLNKLQIEKFEVHPQSTRTVVHYSLGYDNSTGEYVPVQMSFIDLPDVSFDTTLYGQVKESLYTILMNHLNLS